MAQTPPDCRSPGASSLAFPLPRGVWARTLGFLPAPEGLVAARCRKGHPAPRCLAPEFRDLWMPERLALVTLEGLLLADDELCCCLSFGVEKLRDFQVTAWPGCLLLGLLPSPDHSCDLGEFVQVRRTPVQAAEACDLFHALELGRRTIRLPPPIIQQAMQELTQPEVTPEMKFLCDLGLLGWRFVAKLPAKSAWEGMVFDNPGDKVPLALFDLEVDFSLPGGDGSVEAAVGFISTDLDFTYMLRDLCEYQVSRWMSDCCGIDPALYNRFIVDAPDLSAAYKEAARLTQQV
ncbi:unnamed protein product [Effrenium voratum]|nr:unnamed protein product [Effrenium voratum]